MTPFKAYMSLYKDVLRHLKYSYLELMMIAIINDDIHRLLYFPGLGNQLLPTYWNFHVYFPYVAITILDSIQ